MDSEDLSVFCGNLSPEVTEDILYELFLQAAPVVNVRIPIDKKGKNSNFGFVQFVHVESVPYAISLMNGIKLCGRNIIVKRRNGTGNSPQISQPNKAAEEAHIAQNLPSLEAFGQLLLTINNNMGFNGMNTFKNLNAIGQFNGRNFGTPQNQLPSNRHNNAGHCNNEVIYKRHVNETKFNRDNWFGSNDRPENRNDKFDNRNERFENRLERFENRNERFDNRNERFENKNERFENRSERARSDRFDTSEVNNRNEHSNNRNQWQNKNDSGNRNDNRFSPWGKDNRKQPRWHQSNRRR